MKGTPFKLKQKLSPKAAKDKAARDLDMAKSPARRAKKADSQKKRRKKTPAYLKGKDYDHKSGSFKSVKANRGNDTEGTKKEGKRNYKI